MSLAQHQAIARKQALLTGAALCLDRRHSPIGALFNTNKLPVVSLFELRVRLLHVLQELNAIVIPVDLIITIANQGLKFIPKNLPK
jgi:orotate phosphoribosyltransferase